MYEAADDSFLLAKAVREHARGRVLDLGTGSGILADAAHERGLAVVAVDLNKEVVKALRTKPYPVTWSDRFSRVRGRFDTIVCNPPYLPADDGVEDIALYGGAKGYEYICTVIAEAKKHLTDDGQLLFLISTLTKPAIVEQTLFSEGYVWEIVAKQSLFMEALFVYRATFALGEPASVLGKGTRSIVYLVGKHAVKKTTPIRAAKEAALLRKVNAVRIGPKLIACNSGTLTMAVVRGERFDTFIERTRDKRVMLQLLLQARTLDKLGIRKQELTRPGKNVLVTKRKKVVLLDFERSLYSPRPANVTQIATWLGRFLKKDMQSVLAAYSKTPDDAAFKTVRSALKL